RDSDRKRPGRGISDARGRSAMQRCWFRPKRRETASRQSRQPDRRSLASLGAVKKKLPTNRQQLQPTARKAGDWPRLTRMAPPGSRMPTKHTNYTKEKDVVLRFSRRFACLVDR